MICFCKLIMAFRIRLLFVQKDTNSSANATDSLIFFFFLQLKTPYKSFLCPLVSSSFSNDTHKHICCSRLLNSCHESGVSYWRTPHTTTFLLDFSSPFTFLIHTIHWSLSWAVLIHFFHFVFAPVQIKHNQEENTIQDLLILFSYLTDCSYPFTAWHMLL